MFPKNSGSDMSKPWHINTSAFRMFGRSKRSVLILPEPMPICGARGFEKIYFSIEIPLKKFQFGPKYH